MGWQKVTIVVMMAGFASSLGAQPLLDKKANGRQLFGNLTLSPALARTSPQLFGISGGTVPTQSLSGVKKSETGDCIGFVDSSPDHQITLTSNFKYLRLQVKSSGDTIMLVKGPGGTWCSDDVSDRNPVIAGEWLQGTYSVWIGSYEPNASFPYLLLVSSEVPNEVPRDPNGVAK
jgi:hypothetical protein